MRLYHYTCEHGASQIRAAGELRPWRQPMLGNLELVWLTDMDVPDRLGLGLTSMALDCDRTRHRVTVDCDAERWVTWARRLPSEQRWSLELVAGALPMHWWISTEPVPVLDVAP